MNRKKKKETVVAVMVIVILFFAILLGGIRYRILGSSTKDVVEEIDSEKQQEAGTDTISHSAEDNKATNSNAMENHATESNVIEKNVIEKNVIENDVIENKETKLMHSFSSEQMQQEVERLVENFYTKLGKEELYTYILQIVEEQYGDLMDADSSASTPDIAGQLQLAAGDIENIKTLLAAGSTEYDSDKASLDALIHNLSDRIANVEGSRASNGELWELKEEFNQLSTVLNNYMITVDESLNGITLYVEEGDLFGSWTDEEGNLISKKLDFAQ